MKKHKIIFSNDVLMKIISYSFILILLFFIIINQKLGNMDEIWNYAFAKNFVNGLIPYKDFNVIVTPFSFIINSIFLLISNTLFMFRILYFLYYIVIIYLLEKILTLLNIKTFLKQVIIFLTTIILVYTCYLDYNFIQYILILILILLNMKNPTYQNKLLNILIPLISGITIINKQSSGIIIALINIILILLNKLYFKKNIKSSFILKQILITIIPSIIFILYLLITKSFNDFYDIAILGMTVFNNKLYIPIMILIVILLYLAMTIKLIKNKKNYDLWIIFLYALSSISFAIPIFDPIHVAFCVVLSFIFLIYMINNELKTHNWLIYFLFPIYITLIIINANSYFTSIKMNEGVYKYIPIHDGTEQIIENVDRYITNMSKQNNVYILDMSAALFYQNIDIYNKYFDMFMNGNFGIKGKKEMLDIIDNENNILLINETNNNWQKPQDIITHVKENYYLCGSIERFTIYCKK